jgi:hypothetical protein
MKKYKLVFREGVKIPNKLCGALLAFCKQYIESSNAISLTYESLENLVENIKEEQNRLLLTKEFSRCDRVYIHQWNGQNNNPCLALYRNYNTYTSSQGCFLNIYSQDAPSVLASETLFSGNQNKA